MKLDDEVIAHIAKTIQIAILTGTDIVDHLRYIDLEESDGKVFLTESFRATAEVNIQKMLKGAEEMIATNEKVLNLEE